MTAQKNETIVDRVVQRLRAAPIGDLITEEDLHEIIRDALPNVFFEKRIRVEGSGYHEKKVEMPALIHEVMAEVLRDKAKEIVGAWVKDNEVAMIGHWKEVFNKGIVDFARDHQKTLVQDAMRPMMLAMLQAINEERSRNGKPLLPLFF